ncbi:hypothetical protein [Paenibacillus sp. DMB5]|uniref:hypothetical protein n=1 Tax=Paenibacillus sp. DMB5 TaxID=1780103 RepID=UPI00076D8A82|nr:hypothetical protein [Paenibacillus sp. DMB5]KUP23106.1 hypothetical protein AWJ19_22780 [Paenibacillus sp. DMB5]
MLKVSPDYRHAYVLDNEIYLLGFDPEQAASKLTEEGRAMVETLYSMYQHSYEQAYSFINLVTQNGNSIRSFSEQIEAYIAAHAMTEQSFPIWFPILQLLDRVETIHAGWGIGWEARTHMIIENQRFHLRCI